MNVIDQSHNEYMRKCRKESARIARLPVKRVTKQDIIKDIQAHYPEARCRVDKTALGKGVIYVECNHGTADRIGQFCLRTYSKQVHTYFVTHIWRSGHISIYFKR